MPFPASRFTRAGATPDQLNKLEADYDALTPDAQAGYDARIAPLSDAGVAELLVEPVAKVEEEPEVEEPVEEVVVPDAPRGRTSSGSDSGK